MIQKTLIKNPTSKTDFHSARFKSNIGDTVIKKCRMYALIDKGVYKIDYCPNCKSKNTYHKRMMKYNDDYLFNMNNVWKTEIIKDESRNIYIKKDYCYDCQSEFMIEFYVHRVYPKFAHWYIKLRCKLDRKYRLTR